MVRGKGVQNMAEQLMMPAVAAVYREVDNIEMGVLKDGTAYLSQRGVARLCGVDESTIRAQRDRWSSGVRDNEFAKTLQAQGYSKPEIFFDAKVAGTDINAYPEVVVMALLEFYAFDSKSPSTKALENFRKLGRAGFRLFVYRALGYDPANRIPPEWRAFHDRLLLNKPVPGYFNVFKESSDIVLAAIGQGLPVDSHTVPDISIGQAWAKYWKDSKLEAKHGGNKKADHNYPDDFPQAKSNPQEVNVYPVSALGDFRTWMETTYLPSKFPKYLDGKVSQGLMTPSTAELLLEAVVPDLQALPEKKK
jgi:hypothetical protein